MAQSVRVGSPAARQPEGPAGLRHALRSDVQNNWIYERPGRRGPGAAAGRRVRPAGRRRGHESDRDLGPPPPAGPVRPATVARATRAPARQVACQYGLQAMLSDSPSRYQCLFDNDSRRRGRGRLPATFQSPDGPQIVRLVRDQWPRRKFRRCARFRASLRCLLSALFRWLHAWCTVITLSPDPL